MSPSSSPKRAPATVYGRLTELCGGAITPESLGAQTPETIQKCGMTMKKAQNLAAIAGRVLSGETDLSHLDSLSDEEVIRVLSALPGVGEWTAQMLMIFSMGRPDVISYKDLGIRRGMMAAYGLNSLDKKQFDAISAAYHPYASTASIYLWHLSDEVSGNVGLARDQLTARFFERSPLPWTSGIPSMNRPVRSTIRSR